MTTERVRQIEARAFRILYGERVPDGRVRESKRGPGDHAGPNRGGALGADLGGHGRGARGGRMMPAVLTRGTTLPAHAPSRRAYRVIAKLKNNRLYHAILARWPEVQTQNAMAERLGMRPTALGKLLNMTWWPWSTRREAWSPVAIRVATRLRETPEYLFDAELYGRAPSPLVLEVDRPMLEASGMLALPEGPEDVYAKKQMLEGLAAALHSLRPREEKILRARFGLETGVAQTLEEIAKTEAVTRERIRGIESKALRKLRHPFRLRHLAGPRPTMTLS